MSTFVDTSVIIPLLDDQSPHHAWCVSQMASVDRPVVIADIVYAELSVGMPDKDTTDEALERFDFQRIRFSDDALFRAGRAFLAYKNNAGSRDSLLPDFLVGALAASEGEPLLTRDTSRIQTYFPDVRLISPPAS